MKCYSCGKEITKDLRFCTNCGADLNVKYEREIINNNEEEGKDVANNKTAIIAIILSILSGVFIILVGVLAVMNYDKVTEPPMIDPEPVYEYDFSKYSRFYLLGEDYLFMDSLSYYLDNGFEFKSTKPTDMIKPKERIQTKLYKGDVVLYIEIYNNTSMSHIIEDSLITSVSYRIDETKTEVNNSNEIEEDTKDISRTDYLFVLPESIKAYDTLDEVVSAYGSYDDKRIDTNTYVYDYTNGDGYIELTFNNSDELIGFNIYNEGL